MLLSVFENLDYRDILIMDEMGVYDEKSNDSLAFMILRCS